MAGSGTLVIDNADLPSLAALSLQSDTSNVVLWHQFHATDAGERRRDCVRKHAELFTIGRLIIADANQRLIATPGDCGAEPSHLAEARMLIEALSAAVQSGCHRLLWPVQAGNDFDAIARVVERANLVSNLHDLGPDGPGAVVVDMPMIDLTDNQIVELAEDCGAPMTAFWPCDNGGADPDPSTPSTRRWERAFAESGIPWPWTPAEQVSD